MKSFIYALALAALLAGTAAAEPKILAYGDVAKFRTSTIPTVQVIVGTAEWCYFCKIYHPTVENVEFAFRGAPVTFYFQDTDAFGIIGMPKGIPYTYIRTENPACGGMLEGAVDEATLSAAVIGAIGCQFGGRQ